MDTSKAAAALGRLGGKAGTGKAKRRGDSAYYKALRARVGARCERPDCDEPVWWRSHLCWKHSRELTESVVALKAASKK